MSTITISDRICPHCGGTKWKIEYRKRPTKANPDNKVIRYRCAKRAEERCIRWRLNHPEKCAEINIKRCRRLRASGYYKTPSVREHARLKAKRESDTLADNFIYRMILHSSDMKDVKRPEIPQTLLEIKRKQLLLTRQIKNNGKNN